MSGKTWRNIELEKEEKIKNYLCEKGGEEESVKSSHEKWRIRFSDSTFTFYTKGTLYSTESNLKDPAVQGAWNYISNLLGSQYELPTKEFLIGLDETGKGELIGHTVLTGVFFSREKFNEIEKIVGSADTKKSHNFEYWDEIFVKLNKITEFSYIEEKIPPWYVDEYNLNKIMDVTYQSILNQFFNKVEISKCRIVLDDYGIGDSLNRFINFLKKQGAEVIITNKAEDTYLEAKVASLISKRTREAVIKAINDNPDFKINNKSVGSGNAGDSKTIEWLTEWKKAGKDWPWFIKRSYKTIMELDGIKEKPKKQNPPINENLLSENFRKEFDEGKLNIGALSIVCPKCGEISKEVGLIPWQNKETQARCIMCNEEIKNLDFTLRYYCGRIVPDSNSIGFLCNDLNGKRFFENFTIILPAVIRYECERSNPSRKAIKELGEFASISRIRLENKGSTLDLDFSKLDNTQRDEIITNDTLECNAILLTGDRRLKTFAHGKNLFVLGI